MRGGQAANVLQPKGEVSLAASLVGGGGGWVTV